MPKTTLISGTLRMLAGLALVVAAIFAGYSARSPWIIPILGVAYTVSFVFGRWRRWQVAARSGMLAKAMAVVPLTLLIQCVLVGVLYLIGYGVGAMLGERVGFEPLALNTDVLWAACLGFGAGLAGLVIASIEQPDLKKSRAPIPAVESAETDSGPELIIDPTPVMIETFYKGVHYSHRTHQKRGPDKIKPKAFVTAQQIADKEAELGVAFPALLRALYLKQNGGYVGWLFVAAKPNPRPTFDDWRGAFSIDYSDLLPLERVQTLWDSYANFVDMNDPDEIEEYGVPTNAKQIIVLSQRYMDCTVLDYSQPGPPRAGVVDYDSINEPDVWFDTFEDLFAALRREQEED